MTNLDGALVSENFARVLNNLSKITKTLLDVFDIQAFLTRLERTLAVHSSDVLLSSRDDFFEVVDNLLEHRYVLVITRLLALPPDMPETTYWSSAEEVCDRNGFGFVVGVR